MGIVPDDATAPKIGSERGEAIAWFRFVGESVVWSSDVLASHFGYNVFCRGVTLFTVCQECTQQGKPRCRRRSCSTVFLKVLRWDCWPLVSVQWYLCVLCYVITSVN